MPILRNKTQKNFTIISNNILRDKELSLKDRGLICTLMSLPDSWNFSICGLASILKDGKDSIRASLNSLVKLGYIKKYQFRNNKGQFETILEVMSERSSNRIDNQGGFTVSENPTRLNSNGNTNADNSIEYNTEYLKNTVNNDSNKSIIPSIKEDNDQNCSEWNDRMNEISNLITFIEGTKKRVNYTELTNSLNETELNYADRIITLISAYIADSKLRKSVKIAGKYISDDKSLTHLLRYRYAEIFAVVKNMISSNTPINKPDSYYLTALDNQLKINSPELYATIDDPVSDDDE